MAEPSPGGEGVGWRVVGDRTPRDVETLLPSFLLEVTSVSQVYAVVGSRVVWVRIAILESFKTYEFVGCMNVTE